jgi:hypothetical protein
MLGLIDSGSGITIENMSIVNIAIRKPVKSKVFAAKWKELEVLFFLSLYLPWYLIFPIPFA